MLTVTDLIMHNLICETLTGYQVIYIAAENKPVMIHSSQPKSFEKNNLRSRSYTLIFQIVVGEPTAFFRG